MSTKSKRVVIPPKITSRGARRHAKSVVAPFVARLPGPGNRRDAACDDAVAWARASARARRRGLH